jgi:hypothetical protein
VVVVIDIGTIPGSVPTKDNLPSSFLRLLENGYYSSSLQPGRFSVVEGIVTLMLCYLSKIGSAHHIIHLVLRIVSYHLLNKRNGGVGTSIASWSLQQFRILYVVQLDIAIFKILASQALGFLFNKKL